MRRKLASGAEIAGKLPKTAPASVLTSRSIDRRAAAASCGRRRPLLWAAFWPGSAPGFMLQSHEALVPGHSARFAVRGVHRAGDDLCACGEGRHEDVFRPAHSWRRTGGPATGPDLFGAERERVAEDDFGEYAGSGFEFSLRQLLGHAGERQHTDESGIRVDHSQHEPAVARRRFHLDDRRRSAGEWIRFPIPYHGTGEPGDACRRHHGDIASRRGPLFVDLVFPRSATRAEFAGAAAAAKAPTSRLTTQCMAGGLHGG